MRNLYVNGDAFQLLPRIETASVDLVFTSIPDLSETTLSTEDYHYCIFGVFVAQLCRIIKPEGFVVLSQTDRRVKGGIMSKANLFVGALTTKGFFLKEHKIHVKTKSIDSVDMYRLTYANVLVFTKSGKIPNDKRKGKFLQDVWHYPSEYKETLFWNEDFVSLVIETLTKEGDVVIDPFAGSGVVCRVCRRLNRNCTCYEIDKKLHEKFANFAKGK